MEDLTRRVDELVSGIHEADQAFSRIREIHEERIEQRLREIVELRRELQDFKSEMYAEIEKLRAEARQASRRW